jgi:hypothetical protein
MGMLGRMNPFFASLRLCVENPITVAFEAVLNAKAQRRKEWIHPSYPPHPAM